MWKRPQTQSTRRTTDFQAGVRPRGCDIPSICRRLQGLLLVPMVLISGCVPQSLEVLLEGSPSPSMSPTQGVETPDLSPTPPPGTGTPGTATPGTDTPGTDTPGTTTPGTDTPGTDTPIPGTPTPTTAPTPTATPTPTPSPTPVPTPYPDGDNDGFPTFDVEGVAVDCDDSDPLKNPGATETCDAQDNDCDGTIDEDFPPDGDNDGYKTCAGDCDDGDPTRHPGADEVCDDIDTNCSGGDADYFVSQTAVLADTSSIQEAIDLAGEDCRVVVDDGTYTENLELTDRDIQLESLNGSTAVIIDGQQQAPVLQILLGQTLKTRIKGFTLRNGVGALTGNPKTNRGGGVNLYKSSAVLEDLILENNLADYGAGLYLDGGFLEWRDSVISQNTAVMAGGGAYLFEGTQMVVEDNLFTGNFASVLQNGQGGGIVLRSNEGGSLKNTVFEKNQAYGGGAMLLEGNFFLELTDNRFEENMAKSSGGAIASFQQSDATHISSSVFYKNSAAIAPAIHLYTDTARTQSQRIEDNDFDQNTAATVAGAIYCGACTATIVQNIFRDNKLTTSSNAYGGAIYLQAGAATINNNLFLRNSATFGGGVALDQNSTLTTLYNNTFVNNVASSRGGSVYFPGATPTLESNLMVFSSAKEELYGASQQSTQNLLRIRFNDLYKDGTNNSATNLNGVVNANGNISANPQFEDLGEEDFSLAPDSPAINTGNSATSQNDLDGSRNDMGVTGGPAGWVPSF